MRHTPWGADFASLVRANPDSILVITDNGKIVFANTAGMRLLCRLPDSFGYIPEPLNVRRDHSTSVCLHDLAGQEMHLTVDASYIEWCCLQARALYIHDITAQVQERRSMQKLVYRDHLTGLYNRRGLDKVASELLRGANDLETALSILYIDINGLKQVNDSLGHRIGDAMIQETATLLNEVFGDEAIKARIGGDEFVVFVMDRSLASIHEAIRMLRFTAEACNRIPGRKYELSLSIGLMGQHGQSLADVQTLMDQAEQNMYRAKQAEEKGRIRCMLDGRAEDAPRVAGPGSPTSRPEATR